MSANQIEVNRPIRVVMFGSGPRLNLDVKQFLCRLEEHPEIDLLGAFCQAESRSIAAVFADLWKRRRVLSFPLFAIWLLKKVISFVFHPREEITRRRKLKDISDRIHFMPNIHSPLVLEQIRILEPDLGLIYGSPFLKPELFEIPRLGTLGIHHGKVPKYRGNQTTFWEIYNGEPVAGVTIQKINKGLDTGDIVKMGEVNAYRRAYLAVDRDLRALGLDLYIQAILEVKHGTAEYKPQSEVQGKPYRNPKPGDFLKFWGRQIRRRVGITK
jgi:folate-dependent phosphoribosylglycinamide formyltransferase PurN